MTVFGTNYTHGSHENWKVLLNQSHLIVATCYEISTFLGRLISLNGITTQFLDRGTQ